jgi:glycosyltransferase involved in cell wall biosynthesis
MGHKYKVAVVCKTYNHEKYIAEAIESFLMQKTDFDVQIIVHDDASTDSTATIIRDYEQKFPDRVFPIYQTENQYSHGVDGKERMHKQIVTLIDAEYVALCEGDDYWIDPLKLQIQADFLDEKSEFAAVTHSSSIINALNGKKIRNKIISNVDLILSCDDMIIGGGGLVPTASIFTKTFIYQNRPPFGKNLSNFVGDYQLQVYISTFGYIMHLSRVMTVYRARVPGGAVQRNLNLNLEEKLRMKLSYFEFFEELENYLGGTSRQSIYVQKVSTLLDIIALQDASTEMQWLNYRVVLSRKLISFISRTSISKGISNSVNSFKRIINFTQTILFTSYLYMSRKAGNF